MSECPDKRKTMSKENDFIKELKDEGFQGKVPGEVDEEYREKVVIDSVSEKRSDNKANVVNSFKRLKLEPDHEEVNQNIGKAGNISDGVITNDADKNLYRRISMMLVWTRSI